MGIELLKACNGNTDIDLTENQVAHYLLNNNAHDSWSIYDGTTSGNWSFEGDRVKCIGDTSSIDTGITATSGSTIGFSGWFEINSNSDFQGLIDNYNNSTDTKAYFSIQIKSTNYLNIFRYDGGYVYNGSLDYAQYLGKLTHIAACYNGVTGDINVWINGNLVHTGNSTTVVSTTNTYYIGSTYNTDNAINGYMSNIRFYNDEFTQQFVNALYEEGYYPKPLPLPTTKNLVAYYPLTGTGEDSQGAGGNESGTEYNGVSFVDESIFKGSRVAEFNGVDSYISGIPDITGGINKSISLWVYNESLATVTANNSIYLDHSTGATGYGIRRREDTNALEVFAYNESGLAQLFTTTFVLANETWYHIAVIFEPNNIRVNVNAETENYTCTLATIKADITASTATIGKAVDDTGVFFEGRLSNVRIFDKTLQDHEVASLYSEGFGTPLPAGDTPIDFNENFSTTGNWFLFGSPLPVVISDAAASNGFAFDQNGDANYESGGSLNTMPMSLDQDFEVIFRHKTDLISTSAAWDYTKLMIRTGQGVAGTSGGNETGTRLFYVMVDGGKQNASHPFIQSTDFGCIGSTTVQSGDYYNDGGYHEYKFKYTINNNNTVNYEVFEDNVLKVSSYSQVKSSDSFGYLYIVGRSYTTSANTDWVQGSYGGDAISNPIAHYTLNSASDSFTPVGGVTLVNDATRGPVTSFNGTTGYLDGGLVNSGKTNFTVMARFINDESGYVTQRTIYHDHNIIFRLSSIGNILVWDSRTGTGDLTYLNYTLANYITTGWNHIALSVSGTTYNLYINGVSVSFTPSASNATVTVGNVNIGRDNRGQDYFNTSLSDIRFYNRALNSTEVNEIYTESNDLKSLLYYPLTGAVDEIGTSAGLEYNVNYSGIQRGKSIGYFDGVDDHIVTPIAVTNNSSISFWTKGPFSLSNESTTGVVNRASVYSTTDGAVISYLASKSRDGSTASGDYNYRLYSISNLNIGVDEWYYVHFEYVDSMTYNIYINDVYIGDATFAIQITLGLLDQPAGTWTFGRYDYNGTLYYTNYSISDAKVHDAILSSVDVATLYSGEPVFNNLVADYPFTTETRAVDMWASYDGTETGGITYIDDAEYGSVIDLDGTNDTVVITSHPKPGQAYSIMIWAKSDVIPGTTSANRKDILVGEGPIWNPGIWAAGDVLRVHCETEYRDFTQGAITDTNWHMYGQIYDGNGTCYAIYDGQILSGGTRTAYAPASNSNLLIGAELSAGNAFNWNGKMRNARIYQEQLTAQEVASIFEYEKNFRPIDIDDGLRDYYPFKFNGLDNYFFQDDMTVSNITFDGQSGLFNGTTSGAYHNTGVAYTSLGFSIWGKIPTIPSKKEMLIGNVIYTVVDRGIFVDGTNAYFTSADSNDISHTISTSISSINDGKFHHFVGIQFGSVLTFYIDGELIGTTDMGSTKLGNYNFCIGYNPNGSTIDRFTGNLSKGRFYSNKDVTAEQVAVIYNTEKGDFE